MTRTGSHIVHVAIILAWMFVAGPSRAQKPNILWITFEDTSPEFIGCYGNKHARTPVIDGLAAEGVRFTRAFSTGTVCSPSRTAIITGVKTYETGTGHHRSAYPLPSWITGFPSYLKKQGYYVTNNSKTDYNVARQKDFVAATWNESSASAGWWKRRKGQPFFAVFNFIDSHQSRTMTQPYQWYRDHVLHKLPEKDRIADDAFTMPPFYNDTREMRKQMARVYNSLKLTDNEIGELLDHLRADGLMDSTIIFLYADHGEGIPRGKTNGIDLGYRVPFVVWFPAMYRHLSPWGTGVVSDELITFEDLAPTMISLAGGQVPGYMKGRVLLGPHRTEPPKFVFLSSDRSDNGIDMVRTVTDGRYLYSRNYMSFMPELRYIRYMEIGEIKQVMRKDLAAGRLNDVQKAIFADRPAEMLYDMKSDAWELNNLAGNPQWHPLLETMRSALQENIVASRDVMFLPEYEIEGISEKTTPYEYRLDTTQYDLSQILAAASLSGMRGSVPAARQAVLLRHANKVVRYWALIGLRCQPDEVLTAHKSELVKAMRDDYPPAAITAAAIAYDVFGDGTAQEILKKYCKHANAHLALMAINYLLYVRNPEPFITTIKDVMARKEAGYEVSAASKDFLGRLGIIANDYENR